MPAILPIHIAGGGAAIVLGAVALAAPKGSTVHRRAGMLFVAAMLVMGFSASVLALQKGQSSNFLGGLTSAYFVLTALTTVRPPSAWSRRLDVTAMIVAFGVALIEIEAGARTIANGRWVLNGAPVPMVFFLATITALAAIGDARVLAAGALRGAPRLKRHLWRMCFALFIAAGSFFSIRSRVARVLPEPFLSAPMRALPIVLVFATMFYWMWRVNRRVALRPLALRIAD